MAKSVFSNRGLQHVFAQGDRTRSARNSNDTMRVQGGVLYSYSTPIAAFCDAPEGRRVVVITTESHSSTTSGKHRPRASDFAAATVLHAPFFPRHDVSGGYYRLPDGMPVRDWRQDESGDAYAARVIPFLHAANLRYHESRFAESMRRVAQDRMPDWRETYATDAASDAREYCDAFGIAHPTWATAKSCVAALNKARAARDALRAKRTSPAYIRAQEKAAERRERVAELRAAKVRQMDRLDFRMQDTGRKDVASGLQLTRSAMLSATSLRAIRTLASHAAQRLRHGRRTWADARATVATRAAEFAAREVELRAASPDRDSLLREHWSALGAGWIRSFCNPDHFASHMSNARPGSYQRDGVHALVAHMRADAEWRATIVAQVETLQREAQEARAREAVERAERRAQEARDRDAARAAKYPTIDAARDLWRETGDNEGLRFYGTDRAADGSDMIRAQGDRLVTARGASAPLREARAAFAFIARKRDAGALPWTPRGGCGAKAGDFALASIAADGSATFGCHRFTWAEMSRLAALLDAQDQAAQDASSVA